MVKCIENSWKRKKYGRNVSENRYLMKIVFWSSENHFWLCKDVPKLWRKIAIKVDNYAFLLNMHMLVIVKSSTFKMFLKKWQIIGYFRVFLGSSKCNRLKICAFWVTACLRPFEKRGSGRKYKMNCWQNIKGRDIQFISSFRAL